MTFIPRSRPSRVHLLWETSSKKSDRRARARPSNLSSKSSLSLSLYLFLMLYVRSSRISHTVSSLLFYTFHSTYISVFPLLQLVCTVYLLNILFALFQRCLSQINKLISPLSFSYFSLHHFASPSPPALFYILSLFLSFFNLISIFFSLGRVLSPDFGGPWESAVGERS